MEAGDLPAARLDAKEQLEEERRRRRVGRGEVLEVAQRVEHAELAPDVVAHLAQHGVAAALLVGGAGHEVWPVVVVRGEELDADRGEPSTRSPTFRSGR
jgi:acetylglutamate kinase